MTDSTGILGGWLNSPRKQRRFLIVSSAVFAVGVVAFVSVFLLRGTSNESLTYDLNPAEARERTDEGMEIVLKAWTEPQPFGWQGRYFQFRGVAVWPRPATDPHPPTYVLGSSQESCGPSTAPKPF